MREKAGLLLMSMFNTMVQVRRAMEVSENDQTATWKVYA
jgi:hypothetical protein